MNELDLDINNYTIHDLEKFFQLTNKKYSANEIELKEYELREQLLQTGNVDKYFKRDLIDFLTKSRDYLIFVKCEPLKKPTTVPKDYKLDKLNYKEPEKHILSREHDIINQPKTEFIYTSPADFLPGKINQIDTKIITKCLNIDSKFRKNIFTTSSSNYIIQLPTKFNKVVSMELSSIELPLSYFGISHFNNNNYIYIKIFYYNLQNSDSELVTNERVFQIPDGNYTLSDLIDITNLLFKREQDVYSCISLHLEIDKEGKGSQKVGIYANSNEQYKIEEFVLDFRKNESGNIDNTNIYSKLGWNLGFKKHIYCGDTFYFSDTKIEPTYKYIYLAINDYNNNSNQLFVSVFEESILQSDILARISLKGNTINNIENNYQIISEPRKYFGPIDIQRLQIRLLDEYGRVIHMNSTDYSFCLTLKILYDK
tara:strand:- start:856 stop:2133 length:1278 start_codon:yes stop_codon:yes gene_type:complete